MLRIYRILSKKNMFSSIYANCHSSNPQKSKLGRAYIFFFVIHAYIWFTFSIAFAVDINSCAVIESPGTYTLTANINNSSATNCIEIKCSDVILDGNGNKISGSDTSGTHGIHVYNASERLSNIVIKNIRLSDWGVGIYFHNVDSSTIESSNISENQYSGIVLSGSDNNIIKKSTVNTNNIFGIYLDGYSKGNSISENIVNYQGQGIQVGKTGASPAHANFIRNNSIGGNKHGIDVEISDNLTIENNRITYNFYGIYLNGSTDNTITGNTITNNGYEGQYGGMILYLSRSNLIYDNYFDNYTNVESSTYSQTWNIDKQAGKNIVGGPYLGGNYWGDYGGFGSGPSNDCTDSDGDYICDSSYAFAGGIDNYPLKEFSDRDDDGVADGDDNCMNISNPDQANFDGDDFGNLCDNCWYVNNNNQDDTNKNCSDQPFLVDPECGDACESSDTDNDEIADEDDNCPLNPNPGQEDSDSDGVGNACDNCINIPNSDQNNWDDDDLGNSCDNCWSVSNPDQADTDGDCTDYNQPYTLNPGCGNACDRCPNDPDKFYPGKCGCGVPDTDSDRDGTPNCIDSCPDDRGKIKPGTCGCGVPDSDEDNDGYLYCEDNCPNRANDQVDTDGDGLGDVCDVCPYITNVDQKDSDADSVGDVCDNCPNIPNRDQLNSDGDAWGDACDQDDDNDGILDESDNCPAASDSGQKDTDGDGIGDECNDAIDSDGDEWADSLDNCKDFYNPDQRDDDNSGIGDICEFDLSITHVEITQGLQDLDNSQFLVSGKNTWIRVYLDIGTAQIALDPVTARLRFTNRSGQQIPTLGPGAPAGFLFPVNDRIKAEVNRDRGNVNHTLNFAISEQWFWFEDPYITIQVLNESPYDEIDKGDFFGNNYYGPVPWQYDFVGEDINITFVPVKVNGCTPTLADFYRAMDYVEKTYPISDINIWMAEVLEFDEDPTVHNQSLLASLWWRDFLTWDGADDMHYYGLVCDKETIGGTGDYGGTGGASALINNNELAWGLMETSYPFGGATMAHELGHNYLSTFTGLGTEHHVPGCPDPEGINNAYPQYQDENGDDLPRASIGEYGFTWRTVYCSDSYYDSKFECEDAGETWYPDGYPGFKVFQPDRFADIMSYCPSSKQWISRYTYNVLIEELDYRTIIGYTSAFDTTKSITAESGDQEYLITAGLIYENGTVEFEPFITKMLPIGTDDEPGTGPYSIELKDNNGAVLFERNFELDFSHSINEEGLFITILPYHPTTAKICIRHGNTELETIVVSENKPEVTVTYPNGDETLSGNQTVTWQANDADGDFLYFNLLYSADGGNTWAAIVTGLTQTNYVWDTERTKGSSSALVRIMATDGVNTSQDDSDSVFTVMKKAPQPVLISPDNNTWFYKDKIIPFKGNAYDLEDGSLRGDSLSWVSNIDGIFGSGSDVYVNNMLPGDHTITLTATDSDGNQGAASIEIHVSAAQDSDGDRIGDDIDNCPLNRNPDQIDIDNDGKGDACDDDDSDSDGFLDNIDNCPLIPNDQADGDGDGIGDVCDTPLSPPDTKCASAKLKATGTFCQFLANCFSKNMRKPDEAKLTSCIDKAYAKFKIGWDKAEDNATKKGLACLTEDVDTIFGLIDDDLEVVHGEILNHVDMDSKDGRKLAASLIKAAGKYCSSIFKAERKNAKKPDPEKLEVAEIKAETKFYSTCDKAIAKADRNGVTYDGNVDDIKNIIDIMVGDALAGLGLQ